MSSIVQTAKEDTVKDQEQIEIKAIQALSLKTNFAWTFLGNAIYAGCQWGMLTIMAKLGTPEVVGLFALGLAIAAPIFIFANLALRAVQATDARREYRFGDYFGLRILSTAFAILVILALVSWGDYSQTAKSVVFTIGIAKGFEAISDVIYGLLQQRERMDWIAQSMIMRGSLSLVGLGLGFYLTRDVFWGTVGMALTWGLILILFDIPCAVRILRPEYQRNAFRLLTGKVNLGDIKPRFSGERIRKLLHLTLPLGISTLFVSLDTNIPRYFIERNLGAGELGFFVAMAYFIVGGRIVVEALGKSASPRLAKNYAAGEKAAFVTLMIKLLAIGAFLGGASLLIASVAGKELLGILYTPEYATHGNVLTWLMVAALFTYIHSFLGYGMTAARQFRVQPLIFGVSNLVLIFLCFILIPRFGMLGAAYALIGSSLFQLFTVLLVDLYALSKMNGQINPFQA